MNAFLEQLSKIGPARLIIMFGVAAGVAAALMTISLRLGENENALLFSGLDVSETTEITARLDQAGVPYELKSGGASIFVPESKVLSARMMLAADGLPGDGGVGYEIFDEQDGFGATRFVQDLNRVRALEGELARTIRALDGVASARVHLALPERRLFERDATQAKASVWIDLRAGDLASRHARAIRNLIAGAVPGLEPSRVTILDNEGRLLAAGAEEDLDAAGAAVMDDRKAQTEARIRQRVVDLVEGVVGPGKVRAQVSAEMDFNRVTESAEVFDPEGRVVRSTATVEETNQESDREPDGATSVSEGVPAEADADAGAGSQSQSAANRTEETVNYEISKRTRTEVREVGAIKKLSVAVVVDGVTTINEAGETVYSDRDGAEMERIAALVRSAIGFDEARGDLVEVTNIAFAREPAPGAGTPPPSNFAFDKNDVLRGAELFVLLLMAAMVIFLVARPLVAGLAPAPAKVAALAASGVSVGASGAGASGATAALPAPNGEGLAPSALEERGLDLNKIQGQLKASSLKQVAEIAEKHPEESVSIIRTWLHES